MRKKVKLAYIAHDSTRRTTFAKRKKGLLKKVSELSILCGVPACAIVYGENDSRPEVWPPSPLSVYQILSKFKEMPAVEQSKKMASQESFLRERIAKTEEQLQKLKKDNREREMTNTMYKGIEGMLAPGWLDTLNAKDLKDLSSIINKTLREIDRKVEMHELNRAESSKMAENSGPNIADSLVESMAKEQWFKNLIEPPEPSLSLIENGLIPNSPTWSNPFHHDAIDQ